ncbi:dTMP kinase [Nocardia asteroides]|uniref:dTMP kinase n=1 Tax=Nocardia asteroides TaxID=1824 RepID=UPI001E563DA0|nr:dTMP kinase [Nocardia asteroides]UGT64423.1 dTMP kinase [Nocardia asteroides]
MNRTRGIFVAVDGPKHAGKSSVLAVASQLLTDNGVATVFTKEPTPQFRLDNEQRHSGHELAEILAADRAQHLTDVIVPGLDQYDAVVTDRYIASSLVFQVFDGVPFEEVWALNREFQLPDLNIILDADTASLRRRSALRDAHTRLEDNDSDRERALYHEAGAFLAGRGVQVVRVDNSDSVTEAETAAHIAHSIAAAIGGKHV